MTNQPPTEFLKLYTGSQSRLYAFILTLVGDADQASEVLQETNLVLWQKADQFELGTNFMAWSLKVARFQVMAFRKKQSRDRLVFSEAAAERVANAFAERDEVLDDRQAVLQRCIEQLPPKTRELIKLRYSSGRSLEAIAEALGRSYDAVGQGLHRARLALTRCVEKKGAQHGKR